MLTTIWALSMLWYFCKGNIKDHWPHITIANITKMKRVQNIAKRDTKTGSEQMLLGKRCSTQGCCQLSTCKKKNTQYLQSAIEWSIPELLFQFWKWENWDSETPTAHLVRLWEEGSKHGCVPFHLCPSFLLFFPFFFSFPPFYSIFWRSVICLNLI